jgi:MFS superfamily sulfate permease-like transporter
VGYDRDPEGDFDFSQSDGHNTISDLYYMFSYISPGAVIIGAVSILLLIAGENKSYKNHRLLSFIPIPLLVVITGAILQLLFLKFPQLVLGQDNLVTLPVIKNMSDVSNAMVGPDFSAITTTHFWSIVITIAMVASLESLLSIEAVDKLDPKKRESDSNRELLAQGIGNIAAGLVGALPVTAVIVRSSANITAGAVSKLSAIIHALLLLVSVLFIPNVLMLIPNASLAAILIMTGYKLTKIVLFREHFRKGIDQFLPFIVTIVVMLVTDLLKGVCAGILVSVIYIIRFNIQSTVDIIEEHIDGKKVHLIKLPQHITFFNKGFFIKYLNRIQHGSTIIIDGSINKSTDKDVKEVLNDFISASSDKKIDVQLIKYSVT